MSTDWLRQSLTTGCKIFRCHLVSSFELLIFTNAMPTLFIIFGLRFFFYSNEHLPIHVHVKNADGEARFEVEDVKLITNKGLKNKDIALAISIIEENKEIIVAKWKEYHGK
jgi:Domain of unknown function (DUF4160)